MMLFKLLLPLPIAGNLSSAWAAGQVVPSSTTFHVTADEALKSRLPPDVAKRGCIVAGINPNTPPTTFFQGDNKALVGREIGAMNTVVVRPGVKVRWQNTGGFNNVIPGLKLGHCDVVLSSINTTKKHLEQVDSVGYYDVSRLGTVSRRDADIASFTSFETVCGQEAGAGVGTTQIGHLEAASKIRTDMGKPPIKIIVFPDRPSGVQTVVSGYVPIFFSPCEGLTYRASQVEPLTLTDTIRVDDASVSVASPRRSRLEGAVQASLSSLIKDRTYQKIFDRWPIGLGVVKGSKCNEEIFR